MEVTGASDGIVIDEHSFKVLFVFNSIFFNQLGDSQQMGISLQAGSGPGGKPVWLCHFLRPLL